MCLVLKLSDYDCIYVMACEPCACAIADWALITGRRAAPPLVQLSIDGVRVHPP